MTTDGSRGTHVSRYFATLRLARGLCPSQLATLLGASNGHKVGSLIRNYELSGDINDHWFLRLCEELRPDLEQLNACLALDQEKERRELEAQRQAWEVWADQPIDPYLVVRYFAGVYGHREVPRSFCNSREQAEGWAADELKRFRAKGFLTWTRREQTGYDEGGENPRRAICRFQRPAYAASMSISRYGRRFLLDPNGRLTTQAEALSQPPTGERS